jgi:hypothetical protein
LDQPPTTTQRRAEITKLMEELHQLVNDIRANECFPASVLFGDDWRDVKETIGRLERSYKLHRKRDRLLSSD